MTRASQVPRRHLVLAVLLMTCAGTLTALGGIPAAAAGLAIVAVLFLGLLITRLENLVALLFVGALFYKAISIALGSLYFPVVIDVCLAIAAMAAFLSRAPLAVDRSSSLPAALGWWLFFGTALAQLINPNTPSALAAANGFRVTAYEAIAFWVGLYLFRTDEDLQTLIKWILPFAALVLVNGIRQLVWPIPLDARFIEIARSSPDVFELTGQGLARRAFSIFPSPFTLGYLGTLTAVLAWYLRSVTGQRRYWLVFIIAVFGGLASLTRSTLYALLVAFGVVFVFSKTGFLRRAAQVLTGLLVVSGMILLLAHFIPAIAVFLVVSRSPLTEPHFLGRLATWHEVWPVILRHPLLGYGVGSAGDALADLYIGTDSYHIVPHNLLLKLLVELGIVGTAGFVLLIGSVTTSVIVEMRGSGESARLRGAMLLGCFAAILVQGVTGSAIEAYPTNMYFWFLVGVAARLPPSWHVELASPEQRATLTVVPSPSA